ncbi:efflux RND transporter periplasmic adaptor subunit [Acetobacter conturbans]|uniref:Efflux RND transporter periplasmic adaptor subunit n=1 Tax=Acetobacter conturbans TaxID=1737472 RepID=A0ABX0K5R4_9PROT|nr:efflux RND transporter periplasmic adaptor subunit [Acetobacter conturbans]NHN89510.1 efflux RND transporter periplasmic adaptor subunit [Acetobacter conturbans]
MFFLKPPVQSPLTDRRNPSLRPPSGLRFIVAALTIGTALSPFVPVDCTAFAAAPAAQSATPVGVATVTKGDMPFILSELGTIIPLATVTVQTRIEGYLTQVLFTEGQDVKEGDLLAVIDPRPYEALLTQYEGQLAADIAQLEEARMDDVRYQKLLKHDSIEAQTAQDQRYKVQQLVGTVKSDQGLVKTYKLDIEYCHIRAPVSGRIGIRAVDRGNYVTAGQTGGLAILTQMKPISVIFTVPQDRLGLIWKRLRQVKELPVEAWDSSDSEKLATGKVSSLDSEVDTSTGTIRLRALFDNTDEDLFPNQFVNAHLLVDTEKNVVQAPASAIQTGPDGSFVYVVQPDSTVKAVVVRTGISQNNIIVVTSGISEGQRVVISGVDRLHDGARVSIPTAPPSSAP